MGTSTSRGNFYKSAADGSENANVVTDLNNNWDRLDAILGWRPVTSGTMPASAFQGAALYQTDTGRVYVNQGAGGSAATAYKQVLVEGARFDSSITANAAISASGGSGFTHEASTAFDVSFQTIVLADSQHRFRLFSSGRMEWGSGAASRDTNLYRSAADTLRTDDSFSVGGTLTVAGATSLAAASLSGDLVVNGATLRPQLFVAASISNSSAETVLQTVTIPANDATPGAVYRIRVYGAAVATGTPSITFRARLGGVSGTTLVSFTAVTVRSGMPDGYYDMDIILTNTTTGASGLWSVMAKYTHNFTGSVTTYTTIGPIVIGDIARDTTASQALVFTAQWSAASASNVANVRGGESGRVA